MKNKKKLLRPKLDGFSVQKQLKTKKKSSPEIECVFGPNEDRDQIK